VSGKFHIPAVLLPGKEFPASIGLEAGQTSLDAVVKVKISFSFQELNSSHPASSL
jgi:hypothetical protein